MNLLLNHTRYILVFLFISWSLNAQVALPTFQATHYAGSGLYSFSSHTFTNCGATGKNGPTLSNCTSAYSPSWTDNTNYFNVPSNAGIQYWTVPSTGSYQIEVWGAQGGRGGVDDPIVEGGSGAKIRGTISLTQGTVMKILVGQKGLGGGNMKGGGGGSSSWPSGGGGGGYQGGNASRGSWSAATGQSKGGYSYNSGTDKADSSTLGYNSDQGKVIITKL